MMLKKTCWNFYGVQNVNWDTKVKSQIYALYMLFISTLFLRIITSLTSISSKIRTSLSIHSGTVRKLLHGVKIKWLHQIVIRLYLISASQSDASFSINIWITVTFSVILYFPVQKLGFPSWNLKIKNCMYRNNILYVMNQFKKILYNLYFKPHVITKVSHMGINWVRKGPLNCVQAPLACRSNSY